MDDSGERGPQAADGGEALSLALAESLAGFARTLARSGEIGPVLVDLADRVSLSLGVMGAGVSLLDGDRLVGAGASRPFLAELDAIEEQVQEGPRVDCTRSGQPVQVADLAAVPERWPQYWARAADAGVRAVVAIPLRAGEATLGALGIYHSAPRQWAEIDLRPAQVLADLTAGYLALARRLEEERLLAGQLQRALDSRVVIEQAKGIVAVHRGVDLDGAFEVLRRHANNHRATLEETADAVVRLGLRP